MLRQTPFLRPLLFLIAGIVVQSRWNISYPVIFCLFFVALVFFVCASVPGLNRRYSFRFLFGFGLCSLLFASAAWITQLAWLESEWKIPSGTCLYQATVIDEPVLKPKTRMCKIRITAAEHPVHREAVNKKALIYLPLDSLSLSIAPGDCLVFSGQLESSSPYLKKQSVAATGFIRKNRWQPVKNPGSSFSILVKALSVRRILLKQLHAIVPENQSYALAAALMFGYRNELDKDLQQAFRHIGAAHILAISGTHFSLLFGMLYFMLSFTGNSRKGKIIKQVILLPMIWGFAFLTGFSPSVIRAALMLSIWGIGNAFFFRTFTLNTIAAAAFFMLLFCPLYLYDVGFQLSFLAVISIVLLNPYLVKLYESKNVLIQYVWDLTCVSVSAQIGVLPLCIYYFHQFPSIFLLTNICLMPLASMLLFLIPVSLLLHFLFGKFSWMLFPLNKTLEWFIFTVRTLDKFSYSSINGLTIDSEGTAALFLAIILIILLLIKKRVVYLYLLLIVVAFQVIFYLI
jgi:competence protein ComEC